jgi:hypothetical protein
MPQVMREIETHNRYVRLKSQHRDFNLNSKRRFYDTLKIPILDLLLLTTHGQIYLWDSGQPLSMLIIFNNPYFHISRCMNATGTKSLNDLSKTEN